MSDAFKQPDPDIVKEKKKAGWIKAWFAIEVVAMSKDLASEAIREHMARMQKAKNAVFIDIKYSESIEAEALTDNLKKKMHEKSGSDAKAFSVTAEITFMCKNLITLLELVMMYGPSSIEVLEPSDKKINIDEIQNIANIFSGILHQFAASGVGGLIISTDKKAKQ